MNRRNFIQSAIAAIALTASGLRLASAEIVVPPQIEQIKRCAFVAAIERDYPNYMQRITCHEVRTELLPRIVFKEGGTTVVFNTHLGPLDREFALNDIVGIDI